MARSYDTPSFAARLAEFLQGAGQQVNQYGGYLQQQDATAATEQDRVLRQLLGFSQLESLDTERKAKRQDYETALAEKRRQFDEKQRSTNALSKFMGLYGTPVEEEQRTEMPPKPMEPFGGEPPAEFQGTETPTTRGFSLRQMVKRPRTLAEALQEMGVEAAGLPEKFQTDVLSKITETEKPIVVGKSLVTPRGKAVYQEPEIPKKPEPFTLGKGQARYEDGKLVAQGPPEDPRVGDLSSYVEDALAELGANKFTATPAQVKTAREMAAARKASEDAGTAAAVEGARLNVPNPMDADARKQWQGLTNAQGQLDTMRGLLTSGKVDLTKIAGGIRPWVNEVVQTGRIGPFPVPEGLLPQYSTEERQFLASMMDYADQVLRQRSGAQINEQEMKRMFTFLTSSGIRPEVVLERLDLQDQKLEREMGTLEHLLKSQRVIVPPRRERTRQPGPSSASPGKKKITRVEPVP